jgi:hypothetical protein
MFNNTYQLVVNLPKSKYIPESSKLKSITHKILCTVDEKCGLIKMKISTDPAAKIPIILYNIISFI